jgi:hypothetical protein
MRRIAMLAIFELAFETVAVWVFIAAMPEPVQPQAQRRAEHCACSSAAAPYSACRSLPDGAASPVLRFALHTGCFTAGLSPNVRPPWL